jgi:hypothetical protein
LSPTNSGRLSIPSATSTRKTCRSSLTGTHDHLLGDAHGHDATSNLEEIYK